MPPVLQAAFLYRATEREPPPVPHAAAASLHDALTGVVDSGGDEAPTLAAELAAALGRRARPPHAHAARGAFAGWLWTMPGGSFGKEAAALPWPPPAPAATRWWGAARGGALFLARPAPRPAGRGEPAPPPIIVTIPLAGTSVEAVEECLMSKSVWWRKAPLLLHRPAPAGADSLPPELPPGALYLYASDGASKQQWAAALARGAGGESAAASATAETSYAAFSAWLRAASRPGAYPDAADVAAAAAMPPPPPRAPAGPRGAGAGAAVRQKLAAAAGAAGRGLARLRRGKGAAAGPPAPAGGASARRSLDAGEAATPPPRPSLAPAAVDAAWSGGRPRPPNALGGGGPAPAAAAAAAAALAAPPRGASPPPPPRGISPPPLHARGLSPGADERGASLPPGLPRPSSGGRLLSLSRPASADSLASLPRTISADDRSGVEDGGRRDPAAHGRHRGHRSRSRDARGDDGRRARREARPSLDKDRDHKDRDKHRRDSSDARRASRELDRARERERALRAPRSPSRARPSAPDESGASRAGSRAGSPARRPRRSAPAAAASVATPSIGPFGPEAPLDAALNALLARLAFDLLRSPGFRAALENKIATKISEVAVPDFMHGLTLISFDPGVGVPSLRRARTLAPPPGELWPQALVEVDYPGGATLVIETKVDVRDGAAWAGVGRVLDAVGGGAGAGGGGGVRPPSAPASPRAADADASRPPSLDHPGASPDASPSSRKGARARALDAALPLRRRLAGVGRALADAAADRIARIPLRVRLHVTHLSGTVILWLPPPPGDRLWFSFADAPTFACDAAPSAGGRILRAAHAAVGARVSSWAAAKLRRAIVSNLVYPACSDVRLGGFAPPAAPHARADLPLPPLPSRAAARAARAAREGDRGSAPGSPRRPSAAASPFPSPARALAVASDVPASAPRRTLSDADLKSAAARAAAAAPPLPATASPARPRSGDGGSLFGDDGDALRLRYSALLGGGLGEGGGGEGSGGRVSAGGGAARPPA
jgi:hypothetical protein